MMGKMASIVLVVLLASSLFAREYHVSANGLDTNAGTASKPLKTISAAAQKAQAGDTITVHAGTYRERVTPPRGGESDSKRIVYRAAKGDKVIIAIRPERINFASVEKKANVFDCTIENITFLGSIVRIQVNTGGSKFFMDTFNNPFLELPKIGSKEQITCSKESVLVLN